MRRTTLFKPSSNHSGIRSCQTKTVIPDTLPLLEQYVEKVQQKTKKPFAGTTFLLYQHQIPQLVPFVNALMKLGLEPERTYLINIPYSDNIPVLDKIKSLGVPDKNIFHGNNYKLSWKFTQYQIARVRNVTTILRNRLKKEDKLMVIDDNQFFLDALSTTANPWVTPLVLVEPTQRGIAKLRDKLALQSLCQKFPVANAGYSVGKLEVEVPHIAEVNAKALVEKITALNIKPESDVIVLGYGSIGRAATSSLKKLGFGNVWVTCLDKLNVADAVKDGYPIWDRVNQKDKKFDLVIGCSDSSSWKQEDHIHLKDNAILLSLTHGAQELSIEDYLEIGTQKIQVLDKVLRGMNMLNKEILETQKYHEDIPFQLGDGRKITFLNSGFSIAFPGYRGEYPKFSDLKMQPGLTATIAGALQAHTWYGNLPKGAVPLDPEFDQWVMPAYRQIEKNWKGN